MPALTALHLRKSFGPQLVLADASLSVARHEKVALIGANGTGKSTLAKILAGAEPTDEGSVAVRRGLTISYLSQEPVLDPDRSARAVVEDALAAWRKATDRHAEVSALLSTNAAGHDALLNEQAELDQAIDRLGGWDRGHVALDYLHRLGVTDVERPCGARSGGERRRIALAQLLVASPDVAILDEPTNHLDADTAEWLEGHLAREFRGAIILVSHDRYFLDAIATRILELDRGKLVSYEGGYGYYLDKKAELLAQEDRVEGNRQNILRRERAWLARGPKARSTKQKARIHRAEALEAQTAANAGRPGQVVLAASASRQGKTILECRGVAIGIAGEGGRPARALTKPFDLFVAAGDRIGVIGPNGVGKTTLLRAILGACPTPAMAGAPKDKPIAGELVVGKNTKVAYLDQARAELDPDASIFDDVRGASGSSVVTLGKETMDLRSYLELFLFDPSKQRQKVGALSGGERARVALAKTLKAGANLLIFDEPTNDLDLPTLGALEELLISYDGSVIVVTHDRAFLDRVATHILAFEPSSREGKEGKEGEGSAEPASVIRHAGGYSDYVAHKAWELEEKKAASKRAASTPPPRAGASGASSASEPPKKAKPKALTYAERIELDGLLDAIGAAEQQVEQLEKKLADPVLYASARGDEVATITTKLQAARAESARLFARWEELEARKG